MEGLDSTIKISCIVCSYNREKYIVDAIESLINQTLEKYKYEILIIDNNSKDNTAQLCFELLEKYSSKYNLHYFMETQQGLSYARNRGIQEAKGELICYIDDDAIAEPDFLEKILNFFEENNQVGGVGGKIIPKYVDGEPNWMNPFMEGLVSKVDYGNAVFKFNGTKYPIGCNMTYKKSDLVEIGMFDPDLGRKGDTTDGGEEKDIFFKIYNLGRDIYYLPTASVQHVIEQPRLNYDYIKKISMGIGKSERLRKKKEGAFHEFMNFIKLLLKFGAASFIALFYLLTLKPAKAKAIMVFRLDVFRGYFSV